MEHNTPLVSIIIPTFNRASLIQETLDSVINQTYTNWECIVVDDGSTDNTKGILNKYCEKDSRFQYHERPKTYLEGGSGARNFGFKKSNGAYINWLDSDDLLHPKKLEIDLKNLSDSERDFTISQSEFFSKRKGKQQTFWNDSLFSDDPINDFIPLNIGWATCAPLWKKKSLIKYNIEFDERLKNAQDYMYHLQALENGLQPVIINEVLTYSRTDNQKIKSSVIKAPSKAIVNQYLLKNAKSLQLNQNTIRYLNEQALTILKSLYKNKMLKKALRFSYLKLIKSPKLNGFFQIFYYLVVGVFYYVFSLGYKLLD